MCEPAKRETGHVRPRLAETVTGGVGFGSFGTARSGEREGFGSAAGGSRGGLIEIKVKFAGEQDKDLTIYANPDDDGKRP